MKISRGGERGNVPMRSEIRKRALAAAWMILVVLGYVAACFRHRIL